LPSSVALVRVSAVLLVLLVVPLHVLPLVVLVLVPVVLLFLLVLLVVPLPVLHVLPLVVVLVLVLVLVVLVLLVEVDVVLITFKDYTWTARIGAFQAHLSSDAHIGHVTAEFLAWVIMFTVPVATSEPATLHIKLTAVIQAQQYTRAEMKVRGMSTSPWK
jgi:hypothetical protein